MVDEENKPAEPKEKPVSNPEVKPGVSNPKKLGRRK